jgi:hypothetical protein
MMLPSPPCAAQGKHTIPTSFLLTAKALDKHRLPTTVEQGTPASADKPLLQVQHCEDKLAKAAPMMCGKALSQGTPDCQNPLLQSIDFIKALHVAGATQH